MGLGILYFLIPITLVLAGAALGLFFWAIRSGQFDDLETPAHRLFHEDHDGAPEPKPGGLRAEP